MSNKILEFIKNILPNLFNLIAIIVHTTSKIIEGIATVLYSITMSLHIVLDTTKGKKLKEIEKATQNIINLYNTVSNKVAAQKAAVTSEENKLAKIIKDDKNILPLGKKKDDNIES